MSEVKRYCQRHYHRTTMLYLWHIFVTVGQMSHIYLFYCLIRIKCRIWSLDRLTNPVSKNPPTLARCSFNKHALILIIFSRQYQHTFDNDVPIQFSLSVHVCLLYFLLNSSDRNDTKRFPPYCASCVGHKVPPKRRFSLADLQNDILLLYCMYVTRFSSDQQLR